MKPDLSSHLVLGERPDGRTLITARWVLAWRDGGHALIPDGEIVVDRNEVLYAGPRFEGDVARRIDFGTALVSPGLIDLDALSDLDTYLLVHDNQPGWAKGRIWPRSYVESGPYEMYSAEELAFQKRFAFGLLLLNGITTAAPIASLYYRQWAETVAEFEAAADAAGDLGLRVFLSPAYRSGGMILEGPGRIEPAFDEPRGLQGLADAIDFIERNHGRHNITALSTECWRRTVSKPAHCTCCSAPWPRRAISIAASEFIWRRAIWNSRPCAGCMAFPRRNGWRIMGS